MGADEREGQLVLSEDQRSRFGRNPHHGDVRAVAEREARIWICAR
jgi:hypothetical protein